MQLMIKTKPSIFEEGVMTKLYTDLVNKKKVDKLPNTVLSRIATVLGRLSKEYDLYNLLFDQPNQLIEVDNLQVNTKDLMAFVLLDHSCTRGFFSKSAGSRATSDTTNSQAVPLALEGAKRLYNKSYMSWIPEHTDTSDLWKCDVFLPAELASLGLGAGDTIRPNKQYGLLLLLMNGIDFPNNIINSIREEIPNWESAYRPKMLDDPDTIEDGYGKIYNKCTHKIRAMILQGWIWQPICRSDAMICSITNWDEFPPAIGYEGLHATYNVVPGLTRFTGIEPKEAPPKLKTKVEDKTKDDLAI